MNCIIKVSNQSKGKIYFLYKKFRGRSSRDQESGVMGQESGVRGECLGN